MEILSFKISGKFAHFRKIFANNTAFTYSLPPRTTIIGILANILSLERDSYYKLFSSENLRVSCSIVNPIRKKFFRIKNLSVKGLGKKLKHKENALGDFLNYNYDLRGVNGPSLTPVELVIPVDFRKNEVIYEIFLSQGKGETEAFEKVKDTLLEKKFSSRVTLGTANFIARIYDIHLFADNQIKLIADTDKFIEIHTACNSSEIKEFNLNDDFGRIRIVEEDLMPADFIDNYDRELSKMNRLLFALDGKPLQIKTKTNGDVFQVSAKGQTKNIQFWE